MVTDEMVEKDERVYWDTSNDPEGSRDMRAALEAALSAAEPVAAMTTDYLGCEYVSSDIANIEKIAAAGSKGPTEVVYLYTAPPAPSVAVKALQDAANDVIASASDTYKKRNGHIGSFEDESGEKCWIVPFDAFEALRSALSAQVQDNAEPPICATTSAAEDISLTQQVQDVAGWQLVPKELTPAMVQHLQMHTEMGAYVCENLSGAYSLMDEYHRALFAAALGNRESGV